MKYLKFATGSYRRVRKGKEQYCVIGALARAFNIEVKSDFPCWVDTSIGALCVHNEEFAFSLKKKSKLSVRTLTKMQLENDDSCWMELSKILRKKKLYNKVKPFALMEIKEPINPIPTDFP